MKEANLLYFSDLINLKHGRTLKIDWKTVSTELRSKDILDAATAEL